MIQQDIIITDGKKKLGLIYSKVLLKHSDLIKLSYENIDNFDGKLITSIDVKSIHLDDDIFDEYIFNKCPFKWIDIFGFINAQDIIFKMFSNSYPDKYSKNMVLLRIVNAFADYLQMTDLINYCKTILQKFKIKKDMVFLHIGFKNIYEYDGSLTYNMTDNQHIDGQHYFGYLNKKIFNFLLKHILENSKKYDGVDICSNNIYFYNSYRFQEISFRCNISATEKPTCHSICEAGKDIMNNKDMCKFFKDFEGMLIYEWSDILAGYNTEYLWVTGNKNKKDGFYDNWFKNFWGYKYEDEYEDDDTDDDNDTDDDDTDNDTEDEDDDTNDTKDDDTGDDDTEDDDTGDDDTEDDDTDDDIEADDEDDTKDEDKETDEKDKYK